jgi:hypothetical protein
VNRAHLHFHPRSIVTAVLAAFAFAIAIGACDSGGTVTPPPPGAGGAGGDATTAMGGSGGGTFSGPTSGPGGMMTQGFWVTPEDPQVITVNAGDNMPTVTFESTFDGSPVAAGWSVDRGEIGTVEEGPGETTVFTPSGNVGGVVTVFSGLNDEVIERQVKVELVAEQNGPSGSPEEQAQVATDVSQLTEGGGIGGVGGEGLGVSVDAATVAVLDNPVGDGQAEGLRFLYPYDGTVWPRGLLAPLLQWDWSIGDADAVKIELLTTSGSFSYTGWFGRPDILMTTGGPMIRHPVPQDAWAMATNSAGGTTLDATQDKLVLRLTVASGGSAYGPIEQTYSVAPGRLAGTIYYQSYGTQLAKNFTGAVGGDGLFGGAVLSIKVGDAGPQLAAGGTGDDGYCRVCHSVSADGSRMVAYNTHGNPAGLTYGYEITPGSITEEVLTTSATFPGMTPDGAYGLNAAGQLMDMNASGAAVAVNGLSTVSTNIGTPMFSPAGDKLVFNPMAGPGITNPTQKLRRHVLQSRRGRRQHGRAGGDAAGLAGVLPRWRIHRVPAAGRSGHRREQPWRSTHAQGGQGPPRVDAGGRVRHARAARSGERCGVSAAALHAHQHVVHRRHLPGRQHRSRSCGRREPQLRADRESGGVRRLCVGRVHQPPHVRQRRRHPPVL